MYLYILKENLLSFHKVLILIYIFYDKMYNDSKANAIIRSKNENFEE